MSRGGYLRPAMRSGARMGDTKRIDMMVATLTEGCFKSQIVPIVKQTRQGEVTFDTDEHVKPGTTLESLAKLKPAFKKDGSVTAGNASGINDGAAFFVLADAAVAGVPNEIMGEGPIPASKLALMKADLTVDQIDVVEINEAFAAQAIAAVCERL